MKAVLSLIEIIISFLEDIKKSGKSIEESIEALKKVREIMTQKNENVQEKLKVKGEES